MVSCFGEMLDRVQTGGIVVANVGDANVAGLLSRKADVLAGKQVRVIRFNAAREDAWSVTHAWKDGLNHVRIEKPGVAFLCDLRMPGAFNALNAAGAALMARELGANYPAISAALGEFPGIWRRFERLGEHGGATWYSDYGHHPTAVAATITAVKEAWPDKRLVLCFQPHHRNRTKHLFFEFERCFEGADAVVLCEIYDVAGRDAGEDATISSRDLYEAAIRHDRESGGKQHMEYAEDPTTAIEQTAELAQPGDIVVVMGAGDIDTTVRRYRIIPIRNATSDTI
jgi:UDP-N-acetylmuramate--alanine ligase